MVKEKQTEEEKKLFLSFRLVVTSLILLLILVTTVTAQQTLEEQIPSFQFSTEFDLKRACFNNGFFCDSSFTCNITLISPNGDVLVDNQVMTNQVSYRNITVSQSSNNQLGFVQGIESCSNSTNAGLDTFTVSITGDGKPFQQFPQQFFIIILALALVVIGLAQEKLRMFKHMGAILMMIMGVITIYPGYSFINYTTLLGKGLGFILVGLGFYFLIEDSFSRNKQGDGFDSQPQRIDDD